MNMTEHANARKEVVSVERLIVAQRLSALVYSTSGGYLNTNSDDNFDLAVTYNDIYPKVTA